MSTKTRATIKKLTAYLPQFEKGEVPAPDNWFKDFYRLVTHEFCAKDYQGHIDRLEDLDFIRQGSVDDIKAILTAACRSEYWTSLDFSGSVWRKYNKAGTFTTALRRLAELEGGD